MRELTQQQNIMMGVAYLIVFLLLYVFAIYLKQYYWFYFIAVTIGSIALLFFWFQSRCGIGRQLFGFRKVKLSIKKSI